MERALARAYELLHKTYRINLFVKSDYFKLSVMNEKLGFLKARRKADMSLRRYLARRVMVGLLILWVIASLNFVIFEVMLPIEPEDMYRGLTHPKPCT
jgi:hypothetical protein